MLTLCVCQSSQGIDIVLTFNSSQSESPSFDPNGVSLQQMFGQAEAFYEDVFEDTDSNTTLTINFWYEDLNGLLGLHDVVSQGGTPNRETVANIRINTRVGSSGTGSEQNYFIDATPGDNTEFDMKQLLFGELTATQQSNFFSGSMPNEVETAFEGLPTVEAAQGVTDLLTLVLHEVGHSLGTSSGNSSTTAETSDGDYDVDPLFLGGAVAGIRHATGNNVAHLAHNSASLFPTIPTGKRRLPGTMDLLAMASGHQYSQIDLPRKDFLDGASNQWEPSRWSGNRVPDAEDDAFIRTIAADPIISLVGDSAAKNLTIAESDQLVTSGQSLIVGNDLTLIDSGTMLAVDPASQLSTDRILIKDQAMLNVSGGSVNTSEIRLSNGGMFELSGGQVETEQLHLSDGTLTMTGGSLEATNVQGLFEISGGTFSPGLSPGQATVQGDYVQNSASTLAIELNGNVAGSEYNQLLISGSAYLSGTLGIQTNFTPTVGSNPGDIGQTFVILTHHGATGSFDTIENRHVHTGIFLDIEYLPNSVRAGAWQAISGDADGDRDIDITDFSILSSHFAPSGTQSHWIAGDFDADGDTDITDYNLLSGNFAPHGYGDAALVDAVPEPSTLLLAFLGWVLWIHKHSSTRRTLL